MLCWAIPVGMRNDEASLNGRPDLQELVSGFGVICELDEDAGCTRSLIGILNSTEPDRTCDQLSLRLGTSDF